MLLSDESWELTKKTEKPHAGSGHKVPNGGERLYKLNKRRLNKKLVHKFRIVNV